ncbi:hypothetical protein CC2G_010332 [Coprinopsis cinerea AmutBmut pab1-1]|nr:hypothetical protein CC2G_010332 [Coprinopsis cinerea AmutBmut pab1-1]
MFWFPLRVKSQASNGTVTLCFALLVYQVYEIRVFCSISNKISPFSSRPPLDSLHHPYNTPSTSRPSCGIGLFLICAVFWPVCIPVVPYFLRSIRSARYREELRNVLY